RSLQSSAGSRSWARPERKWRNPSSERVGRPAASPSHATILEIGELEALSPRLALRAGELLARTRRANAIDAIVVASAAQRGDLVVTSDLRDLRELARAVSGVDVESVG
ncbi:MAG: hypothetical protein DMG07_16200, partial [Acidobacteria bacterium]